jgi:hypothetical protein
MLVAMKKWIAILLVAVLACGSNKEAEKEMEKQREKEKKEKEEKEKKEKEGDSLSGRFGSIADKAKEMGGQAVDKAKEMGNQAIDKAKAIDFEAKAKELGDAAARKAVGLGEDAVSLGKQLKDKLVEVHKKQHDYDFTIESVPESKDDHEKRVRGMKQLKVGDYSVGYKQFSTHPLGKVYNWQFQITWPLPTGNAVKLALYSNEELAELALAGLLADIVPAANLLLK